MSDTIRIGMDATSLADKAYTGIPLYIESLLREFFSGEGTPDNLEWVIVGSAEGRDVQTMLRERGACSDRAQFVSTVDLRIASHLPGVKKVPPIDWAVRKVDGRLLLPLGKAMTSGRMPHVDIMHHTAVLRLSPDRARKNIVTIYDLTTRFFPETHNRVNIAQWEDTFAFARNHADRVIAISESVRNDIIIHLGIPAERVVAIPLGVRPLLQDLPVERTHETRRKFGIADCRFILSAGSLEPRKNLPRLIEVFAALTKAPEFADVRLVLTGARLHGASAIESAIEKAGVAERVVLTGYATDEELAVLMQTCDCFIYPSLYEGFGLPVIEAMALGAPVAASNTSSLPEVAGDAAILFDPLSEQAMREAMAVILSDAKLAGDLQRRGRARAKQFTWKRCADAHRQVYKEVAGET